MKKLESIWNALAGRRTYIVAVVIALLNLAIAFGWVSPDHLSTINIVLGALGLGALRSAVGKV